MNIKKIISMSALVALSGVKCWGAAAGINTNPELMRNLVHFAKYKIITDVKELLNKRVDINATNEDGDTALVLATKNGHIEMILLLLNHGAGTNADEETLVAIRALGVQRVGSLQSLASKAVIKGRVDVSEISQQTQESINLAELMMLNQNNPTRALSCAIRDNRVDMVSLILKDYKGQFDIDKQLVLAAEHGCADITRILLEYGASVDYRDQYIGEALTAAAEQVLDVHRAGCFEVVRVLIEKMATLPEADKRIQLNHIDPFGMTALMYAAKKGDAAMVQALIDAGADAHAVNTNHNDNTALRYAEMTRENYAIFGHDVSRFDAVIAILQAAGAE